MKYVSRDAKAAVLINLAGLVAWLVYGALFTFDRTALVFVGLSVVVLIAALVNTVREANVAKRLEKAEEDDASLVG